jgi:tetratricopeptide (TPR) repeat protein
MRIVDFEELRIRLWEVGPDRYLIFANGLHSAADIVHIPDPQQYLKARNDLLREDFAPSTKPRGETRSLNDRFEKLGIDLFKKLFPPPLQHCLEQYFAQQGEEPVTSQLRLRFSLPDQLRSLPVEILRMPPPSPHRTLVLDSQQPTISVVRSLHGQGIPEGRVLAHDEKAQQLRLLIIVSEPEDALLPNAGHEVRNIQNAILRGGAASFVKLDVLARAKLLAQQIPQRVTSQAIAERITGLNRPILNPASGVEEVPPTVIVLIAHGEFHGGQGQVLLEGPNNLAQRVPSGEVAAILGGADRVRLVLLNLCHGASAGTGGTRLQPSDPFVGVAQGLIAAGLPVVIGMDYAIGDGAASQFSPLLLATLARNAPLEEAIHIARTTLQNIDENTQAGGTLRTTKQWSIPACLVHADSHCPWLFRLVEPRVAGRPPTPNPLAEGQTAAADCLRGLIDHPQAAVRYSRLIGDWPQVQTLVFTIRAAIGDQPWFEAFVKESQREQELDRIAAICNAVATQDGDAALAEWNRLEESSRQTLETLHDWISARNTLNRLYTEAQKCEAQATDDAGQWKEALKLYEQLTNSLAALGLTAFRDVAERTAYVRGEAAYEDSEWLRAFQAFDALPANHPKRVVKRGLAGGFARIVEEKWKEAVAFLEAIPNPASVPEVLAPLAYSRARWAEIEEKWDQACTCYRDPNAGAYPDSALRCSYCAGRDDEKNERWSQAVVHFSKLSGDIYPDAVIRTAYCQARLAEREESWRKAITLYREAVNAGLYADCAARQAECQAWIGVADRLSARQWDQAVSELDKLAPRHPDRARMGRWLRWCRKDAHRLTTALERLSSGRWVFGFDHLGVGVDPAVAEFLSQAASKPTAAAQLLQQLGKFEDKAEPLTQDHIATTLGDDAGLFHALCGSHDKTLALFRAQALQQPSDVRRLHRLGLSAFAKICQARAIDEPQELDDWLLLIAAWGAVFANEAFWRHDASSNGHTVTTIHTPQMRDQLERHWLDYFAHNSEGDLRLDVLFRAELAGARAVQSAGGIPAKADATSPGIVVGWLGVKQLGLTAMVARWAASLPSDELRQRLGRHLSELGEAVVLFEADRFADVVKVLTMPRCDLHRRGDMSCPLSDQAGEFPCVAVPGCACFAESHPIYGETAPSQEAASHEASRMLEESHCRLAAELLGQPSVDVSEVMGRWARAVNLARRRGQVESRLTPIRRQALDHAKRLGTAKGSQRLDSLSRAVELLQRLRDTEWDSAQFEVRDALVETLLDRAVHLSSVVDDDLKARLDARQAHDLAPWSMRAVRWVCWTCLHLARKRHGEGNQRAAQLLAEELEAGLRKGLALMPTDQNLLECRDHANSLRRLLGEGANNALDQVIAGLEQNDSEADKNLIAQMLAQGGHLESRREFRAALDIYQQVLALDSAHEEAQRRLRWCYHWWIKYEIEHGTPNTLKEPLREAFGRFPDADMLQEYYRDFPSLLR